MAIERALAHDISVCIHRDQVPVECFAPWSSVGCSGRVLRQVDDEVRSAVASLPAGWCSAATRADGALVQLFVVSGTLDIGGCKLGANGFAALPSDPMLSVRATEDSELLIIIDRPLPPCSETIEPVVIANSFDMEPFVPVIEGRRLDGFERRRLWLNERTGADTRLLRIPGGFSGVGPNWHPVEEEIFCLAGDIQPDDTRPMGPGSYLWNPAHSIHGFNERTVGGCVLLEWHDGPWDLHTVPEVVQHPNVRALRGRSIS